MQQTYQVYYQLDLLLRLFIRIQNINEMRKDQ